MTQQSDITSGATEEHFPRKPPSRWTDWSMLLLAVVSVGLIVWITFWDVSDETQRIVFIIDYIVCGIFAIEFLYRWRIAGWGWKFPLIYWYEILGMIPLHSPIFRSFRLLRIIVVVVRLARAMDRAFGDRFTAIVITKFTKTIVEAIKRPITVAVLDEVAAVMQTGHYTRSIASALDENRSELDSMIIEMIRNDPQTGRLRFVPFHDDIVRLVADTTFRLTFQVLSDPRTDELVSDLLRETLASMQESVRGKYETQGPAAPLQTVKR